MRVSGLSYELTLNRRKHLNSARSRSQTGEMGICERFIRDSSRVCLLHDRAGFSRKTVCPPSNTLSVCVCVCVSLCVSVCVFRVCRRLKCSRCLESCFQRWHSWHWERRASSRRYRTSVRPALLLQMLFNLYIYLNLSFLSQSLLLGCFGSRIRDYTLVLWVYVVSFRVGFGL